MTACDHTVVYVDLKSQLEAKETLKRSNFHLIGLMVISALKLSFNGCFKSAQSEGCFSAKPWMKPAFIIYLGGLYFFIL